tara:strand:+ start:583 stop:903 length:321 start_codon:yes stop_codon:yes gene_type:complete
VPASSDKVFNSSLIVVFLQVSPALFAAFFTFFTFFTASENPQSSIGVFFRTFIDTRLYINLIQKIQSGAIDKKYYTVYKKSNSPSGTGTVTPNCSASSAVMVISAP